MESYTYKPHISVKNICVCNCECWKHECYTTLTPRLTSVNGIHMITCYHFASCNLSGTTCKLTIK